MIRNIDLWLKSYIKRSFQAFRGDWEVHPKKLSVLFTICDHYEPYWNKVGDQQATKRVENWRSNFPKVTENHFDCLGVQPKHCFFYPIEEYRRPLLDLLSDICHQGYGEIEVHLHHDNDTAENLEKTILDYIDILQKEHGVLSQSKTSPTPVARYGFIHGNWALDNSRPDGRCCGVNNEIEILQQTGCYADFTMPSAPDITQTSTINSIYYATDDPQKPKSHDKGIHAAAGEENNHGLLCIQGPLGFNIRSRKLGVIPRIENSCLSAELPMHAYRLNLWLNAHVHVIGRPDIIFIKLHTHGTQEKIMHYFFEKGGLSDLYSQLETFCTSFGHNLFYVSARQMYNIVKGLEIHPTAEPQELLETDLIINY